MAHAVDLLVDGGILLDIGVGARDVGFRLVVIVVGDEIFDRVVGKKAPELAVELRRQRLVGREDQRRALRLLDHLRHGEGFAGAGDAQQNLRAVVAPHAFDQLGDRLRLVALRVEVGFDDEAAAAFGFFRPRRPVRHPEGGRFAELRPALAQQSVQRLLARAGRRPSPTSPEPGRAGCGWAGPISSADDVPRDLPSGGEIPSFPLSCSSMPSARARSGSSSPGGTGVSPYPSRTDRPAAAPRQNRAPPMPAPDAHWQSRRADQRNYQAGARALTLVCSPPHPGRACARPSASLVGRG